MDRQLYPDLLRATALGRIVIFHFFGWQLLTYLPALGIMFALGGWFVAISMSNRSQLTVVLQRLVRLLPTWWAFALLALIGGFFYARGAGAALQPTFAWLLPLQQATWGLDNTYANDITVVTWYIAAYIWLLLLSPILLAVYQKLSWAAIFAPVFAMLIYSHLFGSPHETPLHETAYNVLTFGGCWMLGFAKADGTLERVPRYLVWLMAVVCSACGIFLTYEAQDLSSNPVAQSLMSFGVAMLLLSFNPNLSFISGWSRDVIRSINTYAVTIYLFHNALIDFSFEVGSYLGVYDFAIKHGIKDDAHIGQVSCFVILLGLLFIAIKTVGIVETHVWLPKSKAVPNHAPHYIPQEAK